MSWAILVGLYGAHSSAGERPLHTREVPGSIPGAPIAQRGRSRGIRAYVARPMVRAMVSTAGSESRIAHDAALRLPLDVAAVSDSPASCAPTSAQRARFPVVG